MTAQYEMRDFEIEAFNESQSAKIVSIRKKRLEKENAKKIAFHNFMNMLYSVAIVLVIAALFSTYVYKNSLVNEAKYEIYNMKAEIKSLNAQIEELSANIENQTELKNIEQIAMTSLNMQYPTSEQMVYIDSNYHFALETPANDTKAVALASTKVNTDVDTNTNTDGDSEIKTETETYKTETETYKTGNNIPLLEELVTALFNANN